MSLFCELKNSILQNRRRSLSGAQHYLFSVFLFTFFQHHSDKSIHWLKSGEEWPPRDSESNASSMHNSNTIDKSTPWTYKNNSFNPNLRPSNSQSRRRNGSQTPSIPGASSLPPYHPDYKEDQGVYSHDSDEAGESSNEQESAPRGQLHIRRGSEGYEIRPEEREEMLRRYVTEFGEEPGRYLRYIPQPDSEESASEDDVPLGRRREMIGTVV